MYIYICNSVTFDKNIIMKSEQFITQKGNTKYDELKFWDPGYDRTLAFLISLPLIINHILSSTSRSTNRL